MKEDPNLLFLRLFLDHDEVSVIFEDDLTFARSRVREEFLFDKSAAHNRFAIGLCNLQVYCF